MNRHSHPLFTLPTRALLGIALLASLPAIAARVEAQQPAWSATGALGTGRLIPLTIPLSNGKVLVAGGTACTSAPPACTAINSPEIYDPATGVWIPTGAMGTLRTNHFGVRLANGKVLVAGGFNGSAILNTAEIYDPGAGTWSPTGNLISARSNATVTLLPNGKVLVTGGGVAGDSFGSQNTAELYDPATGAWSPAGTMNSARNLHTATLLPNGKVLVASGSRKVNNVLSLLTSAELHDPATGSWTPTGNLATARPFHTATLLPNGKVLAIGGSNFVSIIYDTAELYDPATEQWNATGKLTAQRISHTATLLPNGKVLVAAGNNATASQKSAELYDPATGNWTATTELATVRGNHGATLLANGKALIVGGNGGGSGAIASAELFDSGAATVASVSAASFAAGGAPEAILAAFGSSLATGTQTAPGLPLPTSLAGTSLRVRDSAGVERLAPLFFVAPNQINYQIPAGSAAGTAFVNVVSGGSSVAVGVVEITSVAPGLFSANASGQGVAAAVVFRRKANGADSFEPVARFDSAQNRFVAVPIDLGPDLGNATDQVFLIAYGTGIKLRSAQSAVSATIGGAASEVLFADAAPGFVGLDQVNLRLPRTLIGRGEVDVALVVDGRAANTVRVGIR